MAYPSDVAVTSEGDVESALLVEQPKFKQQTIAYAASITPDPANGEVITIGQLTGAITIANPPNNAARIPGRRLIFKWSQDGTGGRVITWGSDFLAGAAAATTASKSFSQMFVWDGTNWVAAAAPFLLN